MKPPLGARGHEGAFQGALPPRGTGALPYIGSVPCDAPAPTEKGHDGIIRIRLSESASAALAAVGEGAFIIACQGSYPDSAGRWVIHAAPIAWQAAKDASRVLLGQARAAANRPPKPAVPAPPAITPDRRPDAAQRILDATTAPTARPLAL